MPVRKVVYKVSVDTASAKREAAKVASIFQKAMGSVNTGGAAGGGATGGGATGGAGGIGGALVGGIAGYLTVKTAQQIAQVSVEMSRAAVVAGNLEKAFKNAFYAVGTDARDMLTSLREASQGMASDMALQGQAMKALRLGVTSDIDEMSRLMEIAAKRGQEFGRTTEQAFNDITTGIGRLSPRILDNLGFLIKVDDAYQKYADTMGVVKEAMTTVEQRQAILNEVFAQTEGEMKANLDQYQALSAAVTNAKNSMGELINTKTPWLQAMEVMTRGVNIFAAANRDAAKGIDMTTAAILRQDATRFRGQVDEYGLDYMKQMGMYSPEQIAAYENQTGMFWGENFTGRGTASGAAMGSPPAPWSYIQPQMMVGEGKDQTAIPLEDWSNYTAGQEAQKYRDEMEKAAKAIAKAGEDFEARVSRMLDKVPGLIGTSPVTQTQLDDAELGLPQNFADNYLRRLKDEVLNGVEWEGVDIEEARGALGGMKGSAEMVVREFEKAWEDSSLFSDPENLKFIDVAEVQAAMGRQADSEKGIENVKAMFGIGEDDSIDKLKAVGIEIYDPLAQGMQDEITDKGEEIGELLANQVAVGFATGVFNVDWAAFIIAAIEGAAAAEASEEIHEDLQE